MSDFYFGDGANLRRKKVEFIILVNYKFYLFL